MHLKYIVLNEVTKNIVSPIRQKRQYREGKLKQDRIDRLKGLGLIFKEPTDRTRSPAVKVSWETQYETLVGMCDKLCSFLHMPWKFLTNAPFTSFNVEYKHEHGDINASPKIYPKYRSLCQWINTQRFNYKNGKLSSERVKLLQSVGFDFSSDSIRTKDSMPSKGEGFLSPSEFDHYFQKLMEYKMEHGNSNVPQRYKQDR